MNNNKDNRNKYSLDYNIIKKSIIKSTKSLGEGDICNLRFRVNIKKLTEMLSDINLIPINVGSDSKPIKIDNVPLLSEQFKGQKLKWLSEDREFTTLVLVSYDKSNGIDDELENKLATLSIPREDCPSIDRVNTLSDIIAEYPCYLATVVSYQSNDIRFIGRPSYGIVVRANSIVIRSELYRHNFNGDDIN